MKHDYSPKMVMTNMTVVSLNQKHKDDILGIIEDWDVHTASLIGKKTSKQHEKTLISTQYAHPHKNVSTFTVFCTID